MATLECRQLRVQVPGRTLLDGIDLTVEDGSACVLMGPSGAGKSTLLRAVAGLVHHGGTVTLQGRDLAGVAPHRRGVGLLFQNPRLFPTMDVLDNVAYPLRLRRLGRRERRARALDALAEVGLADRADARGPELSGGEQQRVALARALCSDPEVMLLDEPLTGLDLPQRRALVRLLARMRRERRLTWVVVTHEPDDAATLGDTIAVVDEGRLVQHDTVEAVHLRPRTELVTAVTANPNVLRGEVLDGVLHLGSVRVPGYGGDGAASLTLGADRVHLCPGRPGSIRLTMTVQGVERRGPRRVLRAGSDAGTLEVPWCGGTAVGSSIDVWFDPADLWRMDPPPSPARLSRAEEMGP